MTSNASTDLLPTRHSLLSRLKNWDDQDSWRLFFDTYWKLIHSVARRAGLDEAEAQEAVQETVLSVAKEMPKGRYDKTKGTFKGWLLTITRRRIADQMRKRYRSRMANRLDPENDFAFTPDSTRLGITTGAGLIHIWDFRRLRQELATLHLDWNHPPVPPAPESTGTPPLRLRIVEK